MKPGKLRKKIRRKQFARVLFLLGWRACNNGKSQEWSDIVDILKPKERKIYFKGWRKARLAFLKMERKSDETHHHGA